MRAILAALAASTFLAGGGLFGQEKLIPHDAANLSMRHEVGYAIDKGLEWLRMRQTAGKIPALGHRNFYRRLFTKAKRLYDNGGDTGWKRDIAKQLIDLQNTDGSWRTPGKDPAATTAYAVETLKIVYEAM